MALALALGLLGSSALWAQGTADTGQALPVPASAGETGGTVAPGAGAETIKVNTDVNNRMTVPVSIDGQGPFRFLIDTGSERTVVSRNVAGRLGLEFAEMARLVGVAGSLIVETVYVPGLTLGRQNYGEVVAPLLEPQHIGADGILGLDGLQDQRILFDFRRNQIKVEGIDGARVSKAGFEIVVVARRRSGQLIFTDATIEGIPVNVVIDTGAQSNIGNLELKRRLEKRRKAAGEQQSLLSVTGQAIMADLGLARDFRIGEVGFDYLGIAYADAPPFAELGLQDQPTLFLGMATLRSFDRMAIDFKQRRVQFDLPAGASYRRL